jgi:membrane-associated phospholipid phosphatase
MIEPIYRKYGGWIITMMIFIVYMQLPIQLGNWFIVFTILENIFNFFLKAIIQQPRPSVSQQQLNILKNISKYEIVYNLNLYGMPSGHSQSTAFVIIFAILSGYLSTFQIITIILLGLLTIFHRIQYIHHTIMQCIVGIIVGIILGVVVYKYTIKKLIKKQDVSL